MNLADLLFEQARLNPERKAIVDGRSGRERILSFAEAEARIHAAASRLEAAGLACGSQVLVLVPMRAELYLTLAALWKIGATALFLDPSAGRKHVADCCARSRPDAVVAIGAARWLCRLSRPLRAIPTKLFWGGELRFDATEKGEGGTAALAADHPAILTFTSGSTGRPKAAVRSHGLLAAQYEALRQAIELRAGECELATMPIIALVNLAAGITTLIPDADLKRPGYVKPGPVLEQIARFQPDRCVASPSFLRRIAEAAPAPLSSFRKVYTGGAPVFPSALEVMRGGFDRAALTVLYGSTEAEPISHLDWSEADAETRRKIREGGGLPVGRIVPETRLRVIPDQWGQRIDSTDTESWDRLRLPVGQTGEIVVAGRHVIPGYLGGIGDEENKIRVGGAVWHRCGDAGYIDAEGRLWLMGRCAAAFDLGARRVYPFAVECAAVEAFQVPIAACCEIDGVATLVLPPESRGKNIPRPFRVGGVEIPQVLFRSIPLDKRHNAKVDYGKLRHSGRKFSCWRGATPNSR